MGKLTTEVFNPSCCDGGAASANSKSCVPCGCDEGAKHLCERHRMEAIDAEERRWPPAWTDGNVEGGALYQPKGPLVTPQVIERPTNPTPQPKKSLAEWLELREQRTSHWTPKDPGPTRPSNIPTDAAGRKQYPIMSGVLRYFPDAIVEVAHVSWHGNNQHNPGEPLHWARKKSMDQEDTIIRHLMESAPGKAGRDSDGIRHLAKAAWRMLAALQLEIEREREEGSS